jgi:hypothetical protein
MTIQPPFSRETNPPPKLMRDGEWGGTGGTGPPGGGVTGAEPPLRGVADDQTEGGVDAPLGVDTSTGERAGARGRQHSCRDFPPPE